jgi:CxxC motif-containing protein (DUF1111 family)
MSSRTFKYLPSAIGAVALAGAACGGQSPTEGVGEQEQSVSVGGSVSGLTAAQQTLFSNGATQFNQIETIADGLGPVFNEKSCGTCHDESGQGGAGVQIETRAGQLSNGVFNPLSNFGGSLFQHFGIGGQVPNRACTNQGQVVPSIANVTAGRVTLALFGDGLVDATPDSTFQNIANNQPSAIRGSAPMVPNISAGHNTVGKFGWKDQNPTLFQFAGDAYRNEMGITNPQFPTENVPQGTPGGQISRTMLANCDDPNSGVSTPDPEDNGSDVTAFTNFMKMLAPPPRGSITSQVTSGDAVFTQIGCDGCHVRNITSGTARDQSGNVISAISNVQYHPFGDFLLHNMGSLNDNIDQGAGFAMRTAPLWGLRLRNPSNLLHDGRAHSIQQAIVLHDGQGKTAANAFNALSSTNQNNLLAFLQSL